MAGASSPRPDDHDCLRLPAASPPRTRGAKKKESPAPRLTHPCPPYVTQSSISSFGRRLNGVRTAENKSLKNNGANNFCQSSASVVFDIENHPIRSIGFLLAALIFMGTIILGAMH